MFQIEVLNKRPLVNNQQKVLIFFGIVAILPFLLYVFFALSANSFDIIKTLLSVVTNDLLILITVAVCLAIVYNILTQPPIQIKLQIDDKNLMLGTNTFKRSEVISWAVVDLDEIFEIIFKLDDLRSPFQYIYLDSHNPKLQEVLTYLAQNFPYDEELNQADKIHYVFRLIGLK
jgi:hypothetical protein